MTWLSKQQSVECSSFSHPFMLTIMRGVEKCASYCRFWRLVSLHKVKQKTKQSSVNANYSKRSHQIHGATLNDYCPASLNGTVTMVTKGSECDVDIHADKPKH